MFTIFHFFLFGSVSQRAAHKTTIVEAGSSIECKNSRRPLDRLQCVFALCDPVTFDLSTTKLYHLIVAYLKVIPCSKFEHFGIIRI